MTVSAERPKNLRGGIGFRQVYDMVHMVAPEREPERGRRIETNQLVLGIAQRSPQHLRLPVG